MVSRQRWVDGFRAQSARSTHPQGLERGALMTIEMSSKTRERFLYLISPIAFLVIWQILLMAGIGDRRFVPAPSDIAQRFITLAGTGELEWHVGVTLYRVFLGYIIGAVPAEAVGLVIGMVNPVRNAVDPLVPPPLPV